jgi:hypothetical protein
MRRRHIGRARGWRECPAFGHAQAELVDRHRNGTMAAMLDRLSRGRIAGILAPDLIAGLENGAQHDPQQMLRSRRQHDLVGIAAQPARREQMIGDCGAQFAAAPGIAVMKMLGPEGAQPSPGKRSEALHRAVVDQRASECEHALLRRLDGDLRLPGAIGPRRNACGDEGAGADGGHRKAVGNQPLIG